MIYSKVLSSLCDTRIKWKINIYTTYIQTLNGIMETSCILRKFLAKNRVELSLLWIFVNWISSKLNYVHFKHFQVLSEKLEDFFKTYHNWTTNVVLFQKLWKNCICSEIIRTITKFAFQRSIFFSFNCCQKSESEQYCTL